MAACLGEWVGEGEGGLDRVDRSHTECGSIPSFRSEEGRKEGRGKPKPKQKHETNRVRVRAI